MSSILYDSISLLALLFVLYFIWQFLRQYQDQSGRVPWVILFFLTSILIIVELADILGYFQVIPVPYLKSLIESVYIGFVLGVYMFNYDRIMKVKIFSK